MNKNTKQSVSVFLLVALGIIAATTVVYAATVRSGTAVASKFDYVEVDDGSEGAGLECITPFVLGVWQDMPNMTKTFTQSGPNSPDEALVFFRSVFEHGDHPPIYVRLLINGQVQPGLGAGVTLGPTNTVGELRPQMFITEALAPGNHTATIQWKVGDLGGGPWGEYICVGDRSLVIQHR